MGGMNHALAAAISIGVGVLSLVPACTQAEKAGHCTAVPLTGDWGTIPLRALKSGTICRSDASQVLVWAPGSGDAIMASARADMEAAGYTEAVHQRIPAAGRRASFNLAYRKGADQVNLYVQPGDTGAEITVSRGR
jgi:hypothetical protein